MASVRNNSLQTKMGDPTALHVEAVDHQQPYVYWNHLKTILLILVWPESPIFLQSLY